jgi:hypothetical protein
MEQRCGLSAFLLILKWGEIPHVWPFSGDATPGFYFHATPSGKML